MAYFLQEVTLRAGWLAGLLFASFACGAEFSHRVHLQQKLACVVCHVPATASTKVSDNNLPGVEICASCHTGGSGKPSRLDPPPQIKEPRKTLVTKFNHQAHLKLGNAAPVIAKAIDSGTYLSRPGSIRKHLDTRNPCIACHRGLETSDQVTAAAFPAMADCLVCHNTVDPPFSCTTCHDAGAPLKPATHTPDWLDRHTTGKAIADKQSCAVCHGRRFTCLGCH